MLRETEQSIIDICYESGYKNPSNFNRLFKKQFNNNPLQYRKNRIVQRV
ncbi:MAG: helix-turn-helix domain-containing protein [Segetibacter sp.]